MPCRIHSERPRNWPEQDSTAGGHVRQASSSPRAADDSNCGDDQRKDSPSRRCRCHRGATSLHDHAWRGEAKFDSGDEFNARSIQGESKYAKRIFESGTPSSEMISSVIFDLDGTLTMVPSPWQYVHERLGVWDTTACHFLNEW